MSDMRYYKYELDKEELSFDVVKQPLHFQSNEFDVEPDYKLLEGHYAVMDDNYETVFGFVKDNYKIQNHREVIESVESVMNNRGFNIDTDVKYMSNQDKSLIFVDVKLDEIKINDNMWDIGVLIKHGLGGKSGLSINPSISRQICGNGLWVRNMLGKYIKSHCYGDLIGWLEIKFDDAISTIYDKIHIIEDFGDIYIHANIFMSKMNKIGYGKKFTEEVYYELLNPSSDNPMINEYEEIKSQPNQQINVYDILASITYVTKIQCENVSPVSIELKHRKTEKLLASLI